MTLTFDLLTPKANDHVYEPKYICDQNWAKFASLVFTARRKASFASAVYATANPSVRPSICLSVTLWYCVKTKERRGMRLHHLVGKCL